VAGWTFEKRVDRSDLEREKRESNESEREKEKERYQKCE